MSATQLRQLLAKRLGLNPEESDAIAGGDLGSIMLNHLSTRDDDPVLTAMVALLLQQQAPAERADSDAPSESAYTRIRHLEEQLATGAATLNYVANVFGACPLCWGQDPSCQRCHGHGGPGSGTPMADELVAWVEGPIRKLGWRIVRERSE